MSDTLNDALLAAHEAGDRERLVTLYRTAASEAERADAAAFYLTHAYVFALEMDHPDAPALHQRLVDLDRETPLTEPVPPKR